MVGWRAVVDRHDAEAAERRVALREESAQFLDERGESEGAERERREADLERAKPRARA